MKVRDCLSREIFVGVFLIALITTLVLSNVQAQASIATVTTAYNVTLENASQSVCYDFELPGIVSPENPGCDLLWNGSCAQQAGNCFEQSQGGEMYTFWAPNGGVTGIGPWINIDEVWKVPENGSTMAFYSTSFPFYQEEDGCGLITSDGNYVAFVARFNNTPSPPTLLIDYKLQDNGSNILGARSTSGCGQYENEFDCREASKNGTRCFWDFGMESCRQEQEGMGPGPGPGFEGPSCWILDGNPLLCENVTGCIYCYNDTTPGCEGVSMYPGETGICEPQGGVEDTPIECENITAESLCNQIPMLDTCCSWNATSQTCSDTFESTCRNSPPPDGAHYCDDWKARENQTLCEQIAALPWLMPCKWANDTQKCEFRDDNMFGDGGGGFQDIGNQQACEAAGGTCVMET